MEGGNAAASCREPCQGAVSPRKATGNGDPATHAAFRVTNSVGRKYVATSATAIVCLVSGTVTAVAPTQPLDQKQLTQKIRQLRDEIAKTVLAGEPGLPSSPLVDAIRTQHGQLQDQIGKGQDRVQQLSAAKAQYEPLEKAYAERQKELAGAESQLEGLARPLGHAAFQAHRAGEVANQPCFADRIALQGKIEALQKEHEQLAPPSEASILQKTKAKAQQLVVAGKIKMEEMKIGSHETQIGKSLLDSGTEQTIACATTADLLEQVSQQRAAITKLRSESEAAQAALDSKRQEFCGSLGLSRIENAGTFDAEIRECKSRIGQAQKELTTLEHGIPDRLAAEPGEMGTPLAGLLGELRQANEQMALLGQKRGFSGGHRRAGLAALDRTRQFAKTAVDAAKSSQSRGVLAGSGRIWRGLSRRRKVTVGVVGGGAIVVAIVVFSLLGRGAGSRVTSAKESGLTQVRAGADKPKGQSGLARPEVVAADEEPQAETDQSPRSAGEQRAKKVRAADRQHRTQTTGKPASPSAVVASGKAGKSTESLYDQPVDLVQAMTEAGFNKQKWEKDFLYYVWFGTKQNADKYRGDRFDKLEVTEGTEKHRTELGNKRFRVSGLKFRPVDRGDIETKGLFAELPLPLRVHGETPFYEDTTAFSGTLSSMHPCDMDYGVLHNKDGWVSNIAWWNNIWFLTKDHTLKGPLTGLDAQVVEQRPWRLVSS